MTTDDEQFAAGLAASTPARLGVRADPLAEEPNGWLQPYPNICNHGVLHASAHVMFVDMLAGFIAERFSDSDWVFTTDLSSWAPPRLAPPRIEGHSSLLRRGRNLVTAEVFLYEPDGTAFGYGQSSFIRVPRRHGDPPKPHLHESRMGMDRPGLDRPLYEAVGIEIDDPAAGRVVVGLRDDLRNPAGAMQGAMVAAVGEAAAQTLAEHTRRGPHVVADLDVRYLAMGRVGPIASTATFVGDPAAGSVRIELRDTGAGDRVMAAMLARVASAP